MHKESVCGTSLALISMHIIIQTQTAIIMSFVKEYTNLFPEGICNCLFPEGPLLGSHVMALHQ